MTRYLPSGNEGPPLTSDTHIIILPVRILYSRTLPWKNLFGFVVNTTITEFPGIYDRSVANTIVSIPPTHTPPVPPVTGEEVQSFGVIDTNLCPASPVSPFMPVAPVEPVAPVGPIIPTAPMGPVAPIYGNLVVILYILYIIYLYIKTKKRSKSQINRTIKI